MAFSYELDDLVLFYSGYLRLMACWEQRFPDRIHRVRYDDLVRHPQETLAGALDFLERDREDEAMQRSGARGPVRSASAWQARQAVHAESLERWRHYEGQAPEFFQRLAALDAKF
jgi:hypothetical protein